MSGTVNIVFIRHGISIANIYKKKEKQIPTAEKFRNAPLDQLGIEQITKYRDQLANYINQSVGQPDIIILSPISRAIQTYIIMKDTMANPKQIYVVPLVSEIGNIMENQGEPLDNLINKYSGNIKLDINNKNFIKYYNYGWNPDNSNIEWYNNEKRNAISDKNIRNLEFKNLMSLGEFTGKNVLVYTHCKFIENLLQIKCPKNFSAVYTVFDQTTKTFNIKSIYNPQIDEKQNIDEYQKKYNKYKQKYLQLKEELGEKALNLNSSNFIDTLNLNNANLYKNKDGLYVIKITPKHLMWRGYNNLSCENLVIPPGSSIDNFKMEPVWFGPPEVAVIYSVRNMINTLVMSYKNYKKVSETWNIDEMFKQYEHIIVNNYSSISAYVTKENYELLDVNNTKNLKKLIELYNKNWSYDSFKELLSLGRITKRQKLRIYEWLILLKPDLNLGSQKYDDNIYLTKFFMDLKDNELINTIKKVLEWNFRKVFGFGNFMEYNSSKKEITKRRIKKKGESILVRRSIREEPMGTLNSYPNLKTLRDKVLQNYLTNTEYQQAVTNLNNLNTTKQNQKDILGNIVDNVAKQIKDYNDEEKIEMINQYTQNYYKNRYDQEAKQAREVINSIELGKRKGYIIETKNKGKIGFLYLEGNKYKMYMDLNTSEPRKYNNPSIQDPHYVNCKLCKLARERTWLYENIKDVLTHRQGLSDNQSYYGYNPWSKNTEVLGVAFQNIWSASINTKNEERVLSIPYAHLGTMDNNKGCDKNSKTFPPNGSYDSRKQKYNCGAYLYADSLDDEAIFYFVNTQHVAQLYAYNKYGKKYRIADINFNLDNGNYYLFNETNNKKDNDPKIYILFHCKVNSEPHIHMHTYIDSDGNNLSEMLDIGRNSKDPDSVLASKVAAEVFGSADFARYKGNKNEIILSGKRIGKPEKARWNKKAHWKDANSIESNDSLHYACSFNYLFKRILGIKDNDERMKHEWILPSPEYDYNHELFNQTKLSYENRYNLLRKFIFNFNSNINNFIPNAESLGTVFTKSPALPIVEIKATKDVNTLVTKYCESYDEDCIVRQSTTEGDAIMLLFLQLACKHNTDIGGYYGCAAPLMNRWKNITHTETCLFNVVDYPISIALDAPYSSCNNTSPQPQSLIYIKFALFTLYFTYFNQYQKKYEIKGNFYKKIDIINNFLTSDEMKQNMKMSKIQLGGTALTETVNIPQVAPAIPETLQNKFDVLNFSIPNTTIPNLPFINNQIPNIKLIKEPPIIKEEIEEEKIPIEVDYFDIVNQVYDDENLFAYEFNNMDKVIQDYNALTDNYKIENEDDIFLAKNIIRALYNRCIATSGLLSE